MTTTFFNCLTPSGQPLPWQPPEPEGDVWVDTLYFGRALAAMAAQVDVEGLVVYLTTSHRELPSYGPKVVAVVIGDEHSRIPDYAHRVRAVFKNLGTSPRLGVHPVREPSWVNTMSFVSFSRTALRYVPGAARYGRRRLAGAPAARLHELPIGTYNQLELPITPLEDRRTTLFFAGSVVHEPGAWARIKAVAAPKTLARSSMLHHARLVERRCPGVTLGAHLTSGFQSSADADARAYSERLMDARIALVPRGTTPWTHRFLQALRYGCVVVTDAVPSLWYYDRAPVVRLQSWDRLEATVRSLLADEARMEELHQQGLRWWEVACSPEAVGAQMARALDVRR